MKTTTALVLVFFAWFTACETGEMDELLTSELQEFFSRTMCQSFCKTKNDENSQKCFIENCVCSPMLVSRVSKELEKPTLKCIDEETVFFTWEAHPEYSYFLELILSGNTVEHNSQFSRVTNCGTAFMSNLERGNEYKIRLWGISFNKMAAKRSEFVEFELSHSVNDTILPVTNLRLEKMNQYNDSYTATLSWTLSKDPSCAYHLLWFGNTEYELGDYNDKEIEAPEILNQTKIEGLEIGTNYTFIIKAKQLDNKKESEPIEINIMTPSCVETFHSLEICVPPTPESVRVEETLSNLKTKKGHPLYNLKVEWDKPELEPDYYKVHFTNFVSGEMKNISGNASEAVFEAVEIGITYQIALTAWSVRGVSEPIVLNFQTNHNHIEAMHHKWSWEEIFIGVLIVLIGVSIIIGIIITINNYREKKVIEIDQRSKYLMELDDRATQANVSMDLISLEQDDEWEIDPDQLIFKSVIGEGAFGIVRQATLCYKDGIVTNVAIKMLKESPAPDEVRQFLREIEIMKMVKQHPHVVSIVGCSTKRSLKAPLLVVEYCLRGDLQTYLRQAWDKLINAHLELGVKSDIIGEGGVGGGDNNFSNITYDLIHGDSLAEFAIHPRNLLSIIRQVSLGMEHLAKMRVVHRDLATRNVLVCEDHTVKVSDFGLSRDVYRDNVYCKTTGGKLPIRWMALESLTHQRYTTQSDVWSFGVLMWEVVTLGATPYQGIHTGQLLEYLQNGYRLEKPKNCSKELYQLMANCWKVSPKERPTFTDLCQSIERHLENVSNYITLDINAYTNFPSPGKYNKLSWKSSTSSERYVKPISSRR